MTGHGQPEPVLAPPPRSPPQRSIVRTMFELRPLPRPRLLFSARAALCMAVPVLAGWLAGDLQAGLMAATGGFTALYGRGRPYSSRAIELAIIALAFALVVAIGKAVSVIPWAVVPTVALIAMVATWIGNALKIGPPGAYMFMMAGAAATAMPAGHISPLQGFFLVLAAGGFAWLAHMSGVLVRPRGPEQRAVTTAAKAVTAFIEAVGSPQEGKTRQIAAQALADAWHALVGYQPSRPRPDSLLAGLRLRTRRLNALFAEAVRAAAEGRPPAVDALPHSQRLGDLSVPVPAADRNTVRADAPLGHPSAASALRQSLRLRSMPMLVVTRVGLAALLAGGIGAMFELERAYWAVAAAVLMLHQGLEGRPLLQRCIERLVGTWIGLLLAGALLWQPPYGLWLVAVIMVLQFTIEMVVLRNYALAVIFITAAALTLAAGGLPVPDLGSYLLARGVDTAVGCGVALAVFRLTWPRASVALLPEQLAQVLAAIDTVAGHLAAGDVGSAQARQAQRELQHGCFSLIQAYERATAGSRQPHPSVEKLWPTIAATEELALRLLTEGAAIARLAPEAGRDAAHALFDGDGLAALRQALAEAGRALAGQHVAQPAAGLPGFIAREVADLYRGLRSENS
ncbi:MAG: FUSC family protein [Xanthomonadales bacterium]|nr:FUSC family protein [Xanthomonadales bacterium]